MIEHNKLLKIPDSIYFGTETYINSSTLSTIYSRSAKAVLKTKSDTESMSFGRFFHSKILEPKEFKQIYVYAPEFEPTDGKTYINFHASRNYKDQYAEFLEQNAGREVIASGYRNMIESMEKSINHSLKAKTFDIGINEHALFTEVDGIKYKIKIDCLVGHGNEKPVIYDLKTASEGKAKQSTFLNVVNSMNYDLQAAFYQYVYALAFGVFPDFAWCVVEKEYPYHCSWFKAGKNIMTNGLRKMTDALSIYKETILKNNYAGYDNGEYESSIKEIDFNFGEYKQNV